MCVVKGKAQLSEDVSNTVPCQCPISSCRVLVEGNQGKAVEIIGENTNKYEIYWDKKLENNVVVNNETNGLKSKKWYEVPTCRLR